MREGGNEAIRETGKALYTNYAILRNDLENMLTPTALDHIQHEAAFHPTEEEFEAGRIEAERIKEMSEHREEVLAPLKTLFLELAKDLLKAEGFIRVPKDLEGVEVRFENAKPCWGPIPTDRSYWSLNNRL